MNVIEDKSPHKTWNNWRQRSRLWYKQENPHSAKRCGEEESALNDRREKIRQCRKKETSELGKVWPILYLTIQFFFSFLFYFWFYFEAPYTFGHNYFPIHLWTNKAYAIKDFFHRHALFCSFSSTRRGRSLFKPS